MNAKTKLDRFYKAAVELESKMDAVLFGRNDEEVDAQGHPIRNAALIGGGLYAGNAAVQSVANYGRGRKIEGDAFNQVARATGAQSPLRPGFKGAFDAYKTGLVDRMTGAAGGVEDAQRAGKGKLGVLGAAMKGAHKDFGGDLKAGAGALKNDAMSALANLKARLGKVIPKRA
jgi:hypothetical protein